jgi:hypothetical protein
MMNALKQWFDRNTAYGLLGLLALHGVAWLTQHTAWTTIPFTLVVLATVVITCRSLVWGFALAMLEIIIGGHGHLIDVSLGMTVGLRLGMFGAVMLGVLYHLVVKKVRPAFVFERDVPILAILGAVVLGSMIGATNNPLGQVFDDANAFVTLLYLLPVSMIVWTNEAKRVVLWTFALGATWVAGSSLFLLYYFTHSTHEGIWAMYHFVRDARLAEVTLLSGPAWLVATFPNGPWFFRVFEPAQAFVMAFTFVLIAMVCYVTKTWKHRLAVAVPLALMLAVDISGQSRSFWVGLMAGGVGLVAAVLYERPSVREVIRMKVVGGVAVVLAMATIWLTIVMPFPARPDLSNSPSYKGQNDDTRELAVSSRWNLLTPMMEAIGEAPLWGKGFGTTVTFISDDPRVRAMNESGEWTTYRFEWGFHDIWMKMGLLGLGAFTWYFFSVLRAATRAVRTKQETRWLTVSLAVGVVAMFASHVFSPYLNHPIGLGFMVMVLPFLPWNKRDLPSMASVIDAVPRVKVPHAQKPVAARE